MATRTMESARDRLITTLVAPITSCSARLPVYVMLSALMLPVGTAGQKALVMLGLYVRSIVGVYAFAYVFNRTLAKQEQTLFVLELPAYQRPSWREIGLQIYDRGKIFLRRAGTVILFDELYGYPGWRHHEYKALCEVLDRDDYRFLSFSNEAVAIEMVRAPQTKKPAARKRTKKAKESV